MKNKYFWLTYIGVGVMTLALWTGVVFAVRYTIQSAQAAPARTPEVVQVARMTDAEKDKAMSDCSALHNAARVVTDDRLNGVPQTREVITMESSKRLTEANRALYRMLITEVYALPESQIRRYPQTAFGECVAGVR